MYRRRTAYGLWGVFLRRRCSTPSENTVIHLRHHQIRPRPPHQPKTFVTQCVIYSR
ncbi:hypothetical protein M407DRAFT_208724 [Tulasnella calospora MUT 4182]|uniref:Uncharacterized protein n=1 Tax=Tulasnella calospora MUT 4182 TaxID=1051891 RepID=A0A0C3L1M4_9AGAM|nr:hypothetical protein M407DRAFT_208724 [Tulasnella calospora MUT 4182]